MLCWLNPNLIFWLHEIPLLGLHILQVSGLEQEKETSATQSLCRWYFGIKTGGFLYKNLIPKDPIPCWDSGDLSAIAWCLWVETHRFPEGSQTEIIVMNSSKKNQLKTQLTTVKQTLTTRLEHIFFFFFLSSFACRH